MEPQDIEGIVAMEFDTDSVLDRLIEERAEVDSLIESTAKIYQTYSKTSTDYNYYNGKLMAYAYMWNTLDRIIRETQNDSD